MSIPSMAEMGFDDMPDAGPSKGVFYVVWNAARTEGFITDDPRDAQACVTGVTLNPGSQIGEAFAEAYEDDERTMQSVAL